MPKVKVKTLIIDDSAFMRLFLADVLQSDGRIKVLGTASNGREGVERAKALKPDVVITDVMMPGYDGLFVVKQLMREMPLPIILLSSLDRADPKIFEALKEGAIDFIDKPSEQDVQDNYNSLISLVLQVGTIDDATRFNSFDKRVNVHPHSFDSLTNYDIITIGASTGGPTALEFFLNNIPENLRIPIVIAQHMPARFIENFATRLSNTSQRNIRIAKDGERIEDGTIYFLPGDVNTRIDVNKCFRFTDVLYEEFNHPSIDCLFESVALVYGNKSIGIILTGMGKDGTVGLDEIKKVGGLTIAQDERTSVIYGMPKSAVDYGAAVYQLSLKDIPPFIVSAL